MRFEIDSNLPASEALNQALIRLLADIDSELENDKLKEFEEQAAIVKAIAKRLAPIPPASGEDPNVAKLMRNSARASLVIDQAEKALISIPQVTKAARDQSVRYSTQLTNVWRLLELAPAIQKDAASLEGCIDQAGQTLVQRVNSIRTEVSRQILRTEPDTGLLAGMLGIKSPVLLNSGTSAPNLAATPNTQPSKITENTSPANVKDTGTGDGSPKEDIVQMLGDLERLAPWLDYITQFAKNVNDLKIATERLAIVAQPLARDLATLESSLSPVRNLIDRINAQISKFDPQGCIVKDQSGVFAINIFPTSPIHVLNGTRHQFWVQGGKPPFELSFPNSVDTNSIMATAKIVDGMGTEKRYIIECNVQLTAQNGAHFIMLRDMAGFEKYIILNSTDKAEGAQNGPEPAKAEPAKAEAAK